MINEKQCKKCDDTLEMSKFFKHKETKDGYENSCKECRKKLKNQMSETSKEKNRLYRKLQQREMRKNVNYRIHTNISRAIRAAINKEYESTFDILPYNFKVFKLHIETQFEWWMTWDNYGVYNKNTWDDDDSTTWTWQIDHIIPISIFDINKKNDVIKCWALENLRPLSSKRNNVENNCLDNNRINVFLLNCKGVLSYNNVSNVSNVSNVISEETRQKMSESQKGKKLSDEHKRKLIESNLGREISEDTRIKMSNAKKGKKRTEVAKAKQKITREKNAVNRTKRFCSEETKKKISLANSGKLTGRKIPEETRNKISESGKIRWAIKKAKSCN